ncbi:MAG: electron transport complex subunit E [Eubacterium sp.]|nr:electron transport complex subunit E [Eubacterium sp.]
MGKIFERLYNGIIKENPTFVLVLGMCPTLAVTSSLMNGAGMGLSTMAVLIMSNMVISLLRKIIPNGVRVPAYIVIVASFVTILQFLLQAYLPSLNSALGIYIPLIVVNCIILGRAESYASKNSAILSVFDGIGMGFGFTIALSLLGGFREILGAGTILGMNIPHWDGIGIFVMAPGAFFVLAFLIAIQNQLRISKGKKPRKLHCEEGCAGCAGCGNFDRCDKQEKEDK